MHTVKNITQYFKRCNEILDNLTQFYRVKRVNRIDYILETETIKTKNPNITLKAEKTYDYSLYIKIHVVKAPSSSSRISFFSDKIRIFHDPKDSVVLINEKYYPTICTEDELFQFQTILSEVEWFAYSIYLSNVKYNRGYVFCLYIKDDIDWIVIDQLFDGQHEL